MVSGGFDGTGVKQYRLSDIAQAVTKGELTGRRRPNPIVVQMRRERLIGSACAISIKDISEFMIDKYQFHRVHLGLGVLGDLT